MKPMIPPPTTATRTSTTELVMPLFTSMPARQAPKVAFAPTDRSIPAVIRQRSMPADSSALKDVCLKTDIRLSTFRKFGVAMDKTIQRISRAPMVPA